MTNLSMFNHVTEYEAWFEQHPEVYQAELSALQKLVPSEGLSLEIGIGTGRFALPLKIEFGVEPALAMATLTQERGIPVCQAYGERLPFRDATFDYVVAMTVICFVAEVPKLLSEIHRVLKLHCPVIIGFIDRESPLGKSYVQRQAESAFYRGAHFYAAQEVQKFLQQAKFSHLRAVQTLNGLSNKLPGYFQVLEGSGQGGFVGMSGLKAEDCVPQALRY